ncbi:hypothetical protein DFS34DRAFT_629699 [Phlyctochytrium arcticum]|nr:hypothetical protein DFS34DRAFT_629699 [Phlyctochytrium arcticum]
MSAAAAVVTLSQKPESSLSSAAKGPTLAGIATPTATTTTTTVTLVDRRPSFTSTLLLRSTSPPKTRRRKSPATTLPKEPLQRRRRQPIKPAPLSPFSLYALVLVAFLLILGAMPSLDLKSRRPSLSSPSSEPPVDQLATGYVIQDPFFRFPTPRIRYLDPRRLVPHEKTHSAHLQKLVSHLRTLPPSAPLPIPVVTTTTPRVILDGHHRVAASIALNLTRIPVWEVDDEEESVNWEGAVVRCYDTRPALLHEENAPSISPSSISHSNIPPSVSVPPSTPASEPTHAPARRRISIRDVADSARNGRVAFGIKGTKHVALVGRNGREEPLEKVTPRVRWGAWVAGSVSVGHGDLAQQFRFAREWDSDSLQLPGDHPILVVEA